MHKAVGSVDAEVTGIHHIRLIERSTVLFKIRLYLSRGVLLGILQQQVIDQVAHQFTRFEGPAGIPDQFRPENGLVDAAHG